VYSSRECNINTSAKQMISEQRLWQLIDEVCAASASAVASNVPRETAAPFELSAQRSTNDAFRAACFIPCYVSNSEAAALATLVDSLAAAHPATSVGTLVSAVYRSQYGVSLPSYVTSAMSKYAKQRSALGDDEWLRHAANYHEYVGVPFGRLHADAWSNALRCEHAVEWSSFFETLHSLGALKSDSVANSVIDRLSSGGFANKRHVAKLRESLEAQRTRGKSSDSVLAAGRHLLSVASARVASVNNSDLLAVYKV